jgi:hypothetical protein
MQEEKLVKVSGHEGWQEVGLADIRDVDVNFQMVSYNPIRQNPSVMSETLLKLFPVLMQDPNIDKRRLIEELVNSVGLSTNLLVPKEEIEAQEQQAAMMMQAQMEAAQGGGAPAGLPPGIPPELAALAGGAPPELPANETAVAGGEAPPEASLAGGGPSPLRQ